MKGILGRKIRRARNRKGGKSNKIIFIWAFPIA